jgi:hypothetical protein
VAAAPNTRTDAHDPAGNTARLDTENALNIAAFRLGQLAARGRMDEAEVRRRLADTAQDAGLSREESERTIASGWEAGRRHPRP